MKVATWNVNSIRPRLNHLRAWVRDAAPDVLCLQETKVVDDLFPHDDMEDLGFPHRAIWGQKTYNGVAILSRHPLTDVRVGLPGAPVEPDGVPQARILSAQVAGMQVVNVYVPNGAEPGSDKFAYKLAWLGRLADLLRELPRPADQLLVCGDFNIAPADADVYDPFATAGHLLCTDEERAAWRALLGADLIDAWRKKAPFATDYTWWDYRGSAFRYNHGFRIDHILLSPALLRRCRSVVIERKVRATPDASDHAPVLASFLP